MKCFRVDTSGNTALHYASAYGWAECVKALLQAGADPNQQNLWNTTSASLAIQKCHYRILDIILNSGPGVGQKDGDKPFLSDANGRDLVSQHLLHFDKDTVDHFQVLASLFKRLKIQPHDSSDHQGFNAFHYLCSFNPEKVSKEMADNDESDQENEENGADDECSDEYDDEFPDRRRRRNRLSKKGKKAKAMEDDEDEMSKEMRKQIKHYKNLAENAVKIAKILEEWGYNYESISINGHSPLTLAAEC